jgi:hypothetical protein
VGRIAGGWVGSSEDALTTRGQVTRHEWLWALAWSAAALALTCVPYLLGAALSSEARVFGGFVLGVQDQYSYLAKMAEGARGAWLFHIVYTSEPHQGALFFLFHILLGKVAALAASLGHWPLTETMVVVYHAARVAFGALLLLTVYRFIAMFTASRAIRRFTFLLIAFSGGFGWLLLLLGQPNWLGSSPIDLILPEGFTFLVLYSFPHIALGRTLLLAGFIALWQGSRRRDAEVAEKTRGILCALGASAVNPVRGWLIPGLSWLVMGLIVPFYIVVAWVVAGVAWLAVTLRRRAIAWDETVWTALACLVAAPVVIYSLVVFSVNPVMRMWSAQNLVLSPHPLHYVAGYALIGLLAIWGAVYVLRRRDEMMLRLVAWAIAIPPLLYLPFNLQRRLIEGWQVPLAILAALGLTRFVLPAWRRTTLVRWLIRFPRYSVRGLGRWAITLILLAMVPTNILILGSGSLAILARAAPIFRNGGEVQALDWLAARATYNDVVLSSYSTGNYIPARVGARVYLGLGTETVRIEEKRALVARFFDASTPNEWRAQLLRDEHITYVFAGPDDSFSPSSTNSLLPVYQIEGYTIYQVASER